MTLFQKLYEKIDMFSFPIVWNLKKKGRVFLASLYSVNVLLSEKNDEFRYSPLWISLNNNCGMNSSEK